MNIARQILAHDPTTIDHRTGYHGYPVLFAVTSGFIEMLELILEHNPKLDVLAGPMGTPSTSLPTRCAQTWQSVSWPQARLSTAAVGIFAAASPCICPL